MAYFSYGTTLAAQTNFETVSPYTLPHALPEFGGMPMPLQGGVTRDLMSGRAIRQGNLNGALAFSDFDDNYTTLNALRIALFGNYTTASKRLYVITLDSTGHYSPWYVYVNDPYLGQSMTESFATQPINMVFALKKGVLQSVTKSANATLTSSERLIYADTSGGNVTLALCAASAINANTIVRIIKTSASNTLTIQRGGSDTVNGGTTALTVTANYGEKTLSSDHVSAWVTI